MRFTAQASFRVRRNFTGMKGQICFTTFSSSLEAPLIRISEKCTVST